MKNESGINVSRPFIPVLFSFMAGILAADNLNGYREVAWITASLCFGYILIFILWDSAHLKIPRQASFILKDRTLIPPILLFVALGYISTSALIYSAPNDAKDLINHVDGQKKSIQGHVTSMPKIYDNGSSFVVEVDKISDSEEERRIKGKITVFCEGMDNPPEPGSELSFYTALRPLKSFGNPGSFDYARHMLFEGIKARCYVKPYEIRLSGNKKENLFIKADKFRLRAGKKIEETVPEEAPVLKAIITGDTSAISPSLREAFNRTGAGHLIAISGLHIGIVAAFSFFSARFLLSFWPLILRRGILNTTASMAALYPVIFYGMVSGFEPSAQRAVAMTAVFLGAGILSRENDTMNTLAASAFIILALMPGSLFSISFRLSYMAVLFILLSAPILGAIKEKIGASGLRARISSWIMQSLIVSLFATLGTAPFVMHYFGFLSPLGIIANLVLIPILGMAAVTLGLISIFSLPFSESIFAFFIKAAAIPVKAGTAIIESLSRLCFSSFQTISPNSYELVIIYTLLISGIILINNTIPGEKGRLSLKMLKFAQAVFIISLILFFSDLSFYIRKRYFNKDLEISFLDVGHGNSAIIELPGGKVMIIDGGGFHGRGRIDTGKDIIAPFLRRKKILAIDYMILTHPDEDHLKGLIYIAENFKPKRFWEGTSKGDSDLYSKIKEILSKNKTEIIELSSSHEAIDINKATLEILNPLIENDVHGYEMSDNDRSLVLKISYKGVSVLFTGDISDKAEKRLISLSPEKLKSDIMLVPHHGSNGSGSGKFLEHVDPDVAIISTGRKNFPGERLLERLSKRNIRIFRTDIDGCISSVINEKSNFIKVFKDVQR